MEDEASLPWIIHTSFNFLTFLNIVVGILSIVIGLIGICVGFVHSSALAFAFLIPYGVLILLSLHSGVRCTDQGLCSWFYGFSSQAVAWEELSEVTTGRFIIVPTKIFFLCKKEKLWLGSGSGGLSITYLFYSKSDLSTLVKLLMKKAPQAILDDRVKSFIISDK